MIVWNRDLLVKGWVIKVHIGQTSVAALVDKMAEVTSSQRAGYNKDNPLALPFTLVFTDIQNIPHAPKTPKMKSMLFILVFIINHY